MADNYLDILQKQTNKNMKGVPVDVQTDIGKPKEVNPQLEALIRQKLLMMDPKLVRELKRRVSNAYPDMKSEAEKVDKEFEYGALQNMKKDRKEAKAKEGLTGVLKRKEEKLEEKAIRKSERVQTDKERDAKSRDKMYLDFDEVTEVSILNNAKIERKKGEIGLLEETYKKYRTKGEDGVFTMDPARQRELDGKINKLKGEIVDLEVVRDTKTKRLANNLAKQAFLKYPGEIQLITKMFTEAGLNEYWFDYLRREKENQKSQQNVNE